jgi:hypothetical protein
VNLDEDLEDAAAAGAGHPGVRRARAWLSRAVEPGTIDFWRFVDRAGPVEAVRQIRCGRAPERIRALVGARAGQDETLADLRRAERCEARLVTPEDDEWPAFPLHSLIRAVAEEPDDPKDQSPRTVAPVPPIALWVRGPERLDELADRSVAIVGSRASTAYGEHVAGELGFQLAERGWTVVSGGDFLLWTLRRVAARSRGPVTPAAYGAVRDTRERRRTVECLLPDSTPAAGRRQLANRPAVRQRNAGGATVASSDNGRPLLPRPGWSAR